MDLKTQIKMALSDALKDGKMTAAEATAALYILSFAKDDYSLKYFLKLFEDKFPVLKTVQR